MSRQTRGRIGLGALLGTCLSLLTPPVFAAEEEIEEIVVTGSFIKRSTADSPTPLSVVTRADIEDIGAVTISDVINTLTFNSGSANTTTAFTGGDASTGNTNINLRNLGPGSTLVLVDGKRVVAADNDATGNAFVNTSLILPTIALERVEVVKDGASALYGSDAVAGVVNFLTRDKFEGFDVQLSFQSDTETGNQDDFQAGFIWGLSTDRANFVASVELLERDPLTIGDRFEDFGRTGISTFGQPGSFSQFAASPTFADPDCDVASPSSFSLPGSPIAGFCLYDFGPFFSLVGEEQRILSYVSSSYDLTDKATFYANVAFADTEFTRRNSLFPNLNVNAVAFDNPGLQNALATGAVLPDQINAADPNAALFFRGRVLGGTPETPFSDRPINTDTETFRDQTRFVLGVQGDLNDTWSYDVSFTRSERLTQNRNTDSLTNEVAASLQGFGGFDCDPFTDTAGSGNDGTGSCFFFNPFASASVNPDGSPQTDPTLTNSPELLDFLVGEARTTTDATTSVFDAVISGSIGEIAGGPVGLAVGVQVRRDDVAFNADDDSNAGTFAFLSLINDFDGSERATAVFAELAIPLGDKIDLQLAGRFEDFDALGESSFDPKASVLFRATEGLTLRGSVGTSFRAPSLLQRFGTQTQLLNISDDFSGAAGAFQPQVSQGNPDLSPEESFAFNFGFSFAPVEGPFQGFSVDADYYNFSYDDLVTVAAPLELIAEDVNGRCPSGVNIPDPNGVVPDPTIPLCGVISDANGVAQIVNDPAGNGGIPDVVLRDEFGFFQSVNPSFVNAQELDTSGIDLQIAYKFDWADIGTFGVGLSGSWTIEYDIILADGTEIDGVGSRNFANSVGRPLPEFRANASFSFQRDRHNASLFVRYIDSYQDDQPFTGLSFVRALAAATNDLDFEPSGARINSFTTVDAQYTLGLPFFGEGTSGLTVGGKNIFNRAPPDVNVDGGFDPFTADSRGALWYVRYNVSF